MVDSLGLLFVCLFVFCVFVFAFLPCSFGPSSSCTLCWGTRSAAAAAATAAFPPALDAAPCALPCLGQSGQFLHTHRQNAHALKQSHTPRHPAHTPSSSFTGWLWAQRRSKARGCHFRPRYASCARRCRAGRCRRASSGRRPGVYLAFYA